MIFTFVLIHLDNLTYLFRNDINYRLSALKRNGNDYLPAELAPFPQNRPRRFLLCSASFYVELITYIIQ